MRARWLLIPLAVSWAVACGGSKNSLTGPDSGGGTSGNSVKCTAANLGSGVVIAQGTMTAQIDGVAWAADCIGAAINQTTPNKQDLQIVGADYKNAKTRVLGLTVPTGVGTYKVGVLSPLVAALSDAWVGDAKSWTAAINQGSGSLTMTVQTSNSATGTFTLTMQPIAVSGASAPANVTNGTFNITF
jgi:hypothetical protein